VDVQLGQEAKGLSLTIFTRKKRSAEVADFEKELGMVSK